MLLFKKLLLDSLPFQEDDEYGASDCESPPARAKRAIDIFVARGVTDTQGLVTIAKNRGEDEFLRLEAISFLRLLNVKNSLVHLVSIANSKCESIPVRRSAIVSIYSLRPENTFEIMRPLLLHDSLEEIRISVVLGFAVFPDRKLFDLLADIVFSDRSSLVRGEAIRQIGVYSGDENRNRVFDILVKKLQESGEDVIVQAYAVEGFAHLLDQRALSIVLSHLSNPSPEIRFMAAYSLGHLGDARHAPRLKEMADDSGVFKSWGSVAEESKYAVDRILERLIE